MRLRGIVLGVALLAGCVEEPPVQGRPATKRASLVGEQGRARPAILRLYRSPPELSLPFSTYVPEGVRVEALPVGGGGYEVRFTPYSRGERDPRRSMHILVHGDSVRFDAAREVARAIAQRVRVPGSQAELEPVRLHPWAVEEYVVRSAGNPGEPASGWAALASRDGHWFHVAVQHEAGGSFSHTAELILDELRWADSGAGLGSSTR